MCHQPLLLIYLSSLQPVTCPPESIHPTAPYLFLDVLSPQPALGSKRTRMVRAASSVGPRVRHWALHTADVHGMLKDSHFSDGDADLRSKVT